MKNRLTIKWRCKSYLAAAANRVACERLSAAWIEPIDEIILPSRGKIDDDATSRRQVDEVFSAEFH